MASDEELERTRHMVQRAPADDGTAAQESTLPLRVGAAMPALPLPLPLPEPAFALPADPEVTTFSLPPVHVPLAPAVAAPTPIHVAPVHVVPAPSRLPWVLLLVVLLAAAAGFWFWPH